MSGRSLNRIEILGHAAADPYVPDSMPRVAHFAVVTHKRLADGSERSDFHNCTAWNRNAELIETRLRKGDRVYIDGRMEYEQENEDGILLWRATIQVKEVILLGGEK